MIFVASQTRRPPDNTIGEELGDLVIAEPLSILEPAPTTIIDIIGVVPGFVLAVVVLLISLNLFDRVLKRVDTTWLRQRLFQRFRNKWVVLGLGVLITGVTTSVAFSLGSVS